MQTDFDKIKGLKYMYTLDTITIQTTKFNIINTHALASGDCVLPSFNDDNTQSSMQAMCMIDIYFNMQWLQTLFSPKRFRGHGYYNHCQPVCGMHTTVYSISIKLYDC